MINRLLPVFLLGILLAACSDDNGANPAPVVPTVPRGLYIINEGNFMRGNASLSFFVPDSAVMYNNVFQSINGRPLGDVGNSITMHKGRAYIVVNNSHRIEVIDPSTHKSIKSIICPPGSSPRAIAFDESGTGYITNLYANSVSVYDDESNTITKSIPVGPNPDGIAVALGNVYVANSGFGATNTVSIISIARKEVIATLHVGDYPTAVMNMPGGSIGVLCAGAYNDFNDPNDDTPASLILIDPATRAKVDSLPLPGHPMRFIMDDQGYAYILEAGVTRIHMPTKAFAPGFISGWFYSAIADTVHNRLYFTNALDYVQAGSLEIYDYMGTKRASHPTGIIPGAMAFTK